MNKKWIWYGVCLLLAALALGGCSRGESDDGGVAYPSRTTLPRELAGARLVYERTDGVYVLDLPGGSPRRIAADATWPRWSPAGDAVFCVRGGELVRVDAAGGGVEVLLTVSAPRALAIPPPGDVLYFTDDARVGRLSLASGEVETVCEGPRYLELDVAGHGRRLVYTVKRLSFQVRGLDPRTGVEQLLGRGCSAGFSPDGQRVMVNQRGHQRLALIRFADGVEQGAVTVPDGIRADNQAWSNHPDWIVSVTEGDRREVLAHRVSDNQFWMLTEGGDCDRPDLWLPLDRK